jgi:hypothetical protein
MNNNLEIEEHFFLISNIIVSLGLVQEKSLGKKLKLLF